MANLRLPPSPRSGAASRSSARVSGQTLPWLLSAWRIAQHVKQQHEGGLPGSAAAALDSRQGDPAALLYVLARRLGAEACLVRVRPLARETAGVAADPIDWPMELVLICHADTDIWYDPGLAGGMLDHVRAACAVGRGCWWAARPRRRGRR